MLCGPGLASGGGRLEGVRDRRPSRPAARSPRCIRSAGKDRAKHAVSVPVWAAWPAVGFGDRDALPTLRTDAAAHLFSWGRAVPWPLAFLLLVAESARAGLRELDRLEAAAEKGRGPSRVGAHPSGARRAAEIAEQTGTALLQALQGRGS